MIDTIIERPLWLFLNVGILDEIGKGYEIILWIANIFYSFVYYGFSGCILWRFWLLFYDINYSKESQNGEWKNLIASQDGITNNMAISKTKLKTQWYLIHIHNFGNFRWVTIVFGGVISVLMMISYTIWFIGYDFISRKLSVYKNIYTF